MSLLEVRGLKKSFGSSEILKGIDLNDGKVKREIRLTKHSFPQNIQVYNGEVYYLFLNNTHVAGRDRRSLYKMRLE